MIEAQKIPWKRISIESVAIVGSILLAFSIDAWWDDTQRREDESIVLKALLDDLNEKKSVLARSRINVQARIDSATKLLRAANDDGKQIDDSAVDRLIGDLIWFSGVSDWQSAPMNSLLMGGDISIITNVALLEKFSALQVSLNRIVTYARGSESFHYNALMPFLSNHANLAQIGNTLKYAPGSQLPIGLLPEIEITSPSSHSELLAIKEFQGLLFRKIDLEIDFFRALEVRDIESQLDEIVALIGEEIED